MKRIIVYILCFISLYCNAHSINDVEPETPLIYHFLPFLNPHTDSTYIGQSSKAFALKPYIRIDNSIMSIQYLDTIQTKTDDNYKFNIKDPYTMLTGLSASWRGVSISYDINPSVVIGHKSKTAYNFDINMYGQTIGFDALLSVHKESQLTDQNNKYIFDTPVKCFTTKRFNVSGYYVIKKSIFSLPAVFDQSSIQKKNAGSPMVGFQISNTLINIDKRAIPAKLDSLMAGKGYFTHFRQTSYNLCGGYGYNWVIKTILLHVSLQPSVPLYVSKKIVLLSGERYNEDDKYEINLNAKFRFAFLWQYRHHSINLNTVYDANYINQGNYHLEDIYLRGRISYRYIFD